MRVNIYAEEITDRVELIKKTIEGTEYTAVRFYLELPTTITIPEAIGGTINVSGPFIHRPGDDDSSAVTFWGKQDLRKILLKAIKLLDEVDAKKDRKASAK